MKKLISLFLLFYCYTVSAQLSEVGIFNGARGERYPLYLYGVVVQQTPDGKALVPRGANFLKNGMVNSDKQYLADLLTSTWTDFGGLYQPTNIPCPEGYYARWVYDEAYKVTTLLFVKNGEIIEKSYATREDAISQNSTNSTPTPIIVKQPEKVTWGTGQVGSRYGSRYESELGELKYGTSIFRFMGQNVKYPDFDTRQQSTDELSIIDLPTHSIINFAGSDFVSMIEMRLTDESGNEVWYLYDTRGGYHPCINGIDCNSKLRGNNHPDDANRWLKHGKYKLWVKNHSTDQRAVQRIDFFTTTNTQFFEYDLSPGLEKEFELNISKLNEGSYKLNCNVWTRK